MKLLKTLTSAALVSAMALTGVVTTTVTHAQDKTVVNWWGWAPGNVIAPVYIAAFNEEYPDIEVRFRHFNYQDYAQALRLGLVSGSGPDVYDLQPGVLTARFSQFAIDLTGLAVESLGADWNTKISPIGISDFTVDGELRGLPVRVGAAGQIWYNASLFDQEGLNPPATLTEWKSVCAAFQAADITCFVQGAADSWVNLDTYIAIAQSVAPSKVVDAINGKIAFTDPDLVEAFRIWRSLFTDGIMQPGALGIHQYPDANNMFSSGDVAMVMMGTWLASNMSKPALNARQKSAGLEPRDYVALPMVFPDVAEKGNERGLFGGSDYGLAISQKSDEQEAAAIFVSFLATSKSGAQAIASRSFPPALLGVPMIVPDLVDPARQESAVAEMTEELGKISTPREIPYPDLRETLGDALSAVAAGTQSPEQAAAAVQSVSATLER